MLHTTTKSSSLGTDSTSSVPFHPNPLFLCTHAHLVALPSHAHHHNPGLPPVPFVVWHGYPFSTCTHHTASLDFSSSLYLTAHRPLPFALVGLFMHVQ